MGNTSPEEPLARLRRLLGVRWWPVAVIVVAVVVLLTVAWPDRSITGKPVVEMVCGVWAVELALFSWLMLFSRIAPVARVKILIVGFAVAACVPMLVYVEGFSGDGRPIFAWRWTPTPEQRFEQSRQHPPDEQGELGAIDLKATTPRDYPGFRGPERSGIVRGISLATDWNSSPPKKLWRHPVGLGWSSFAVVGDYCVTQEQRGEFETVVCYELRTGRQRWEHRDRAIFHEVMGGDGPRATPTIYRGRIYSLGGTGILNCLDGATGRPIWSVNILEDNAVENRIFGMAGSPLVIDAMVVVAPGGQGSSLAGYDLETGKRIWQGGDSPAAYSSAQPATLAGRRQILYFNADGLAGHDRETGRVLWSYPWITNPPEMNNVCQPIPLPETPGQPGRVFLASGYGVGCTLLEIRSAAGQFDAEPIWDNRNLKAKFASAVVRDGFIYGLDGAILTCIDLETGARRWKGGRYGYGQLILVDDLLLIQAESGDVALVEASPEAYRELARFPALDSRTWNYPALAGRLLLVRNDREAACYELPVDRGGEGKKEE